MREQTSVGDIRWLAGLVEGEGSFSDSMRSAVGCPILQITSTDADVVERASRIIGAGIQKPQFHSFDYQPRYTAAITGSRAAGWLMTLYSEMGARRKARITRCLQHWHARPGRGGHNQRRAA